MNSEREGGARWGWTPSKCNDRTATRVYACSVRRVKAIKCAGKSKRLHYCSVLVCIASRNLLTLFLQVWCFAERFLQLAFLPVLSQRTPTSSRKAHFAVYIYSTVATFTLSWGLIRKYQNLPKKHSSPPHFIFLRMYITYILVLKHIKIKMKLIHQYKQLQLISFTSQVSYDMTMFPTCI